MEVATVQMSQEEARKKLQACRSQLHKRADDEYKALEKGYAALAVGTPLIDVEIALRDCPVDEIGRPRLAIARADRKQVRVDWPIKSQWCSFHAATDYRFDERWPTLTVSYNLGREHGHKAIRPYLSDGKAWPTDIEGYALVPMVPPDHRPNGALRRYHILWEVEKWSEMRHRTEPDRDPYLLELLGGSLYRVVAEWDLTDLERAVMRGRVG